MAIFVFIMNLLVAGFGLVFAAEITTLLIGSVVYARDCIGGRNGT